MSDRKKSVLTTGEVAVICQVAPRTVSKWFDSGQLGGYRIPGSRDRRIPVKELVRFMRDHNMPVGDLVSGAVRILVVDHDNLRAESLVKALNRDARFEARSADSTFSAGLTAAGFDPQVILVDVSMPDVCPEALSAGTRRVEELSRVKLVAITDDADSVERLRSGGYDACLVTPLDGAEVASVIDALVPGA